jgi:hypothetical protein
MLPALRVMVRSKKGALVERVGPPNHWFGVGVP